MLARAFAGEQLQHQRRDERALDLNGHSFGGFRHQMEVAEDALHPLEKQLDPKAAVLMCAPQLPENRQAALTAASRWMERASATANAA
jgi:hypothetical protein